MAGLLDLGIAALGGLFGDDENTQTQTQTNSPWAPAQPYMLRGMEDTEKLRNYYQKNPFNQQQIQNYSQLFSDNDRFRTSIAPGLMNFANQGMTGQYQRATGGRPGDGAGYGGARQPGGRTGGLLGASTGQSAGPFSMAQGGGQQGGLLDLNGAQNPFNNGGIAQNPQTVTEEMISELKGYLNETPGQDQDRGGDGYQGGSGKDVFGSIQDMINTPYGAMTVAMAASLGLLGNMYQDPSKVPVEDRQGVPVGGYNLGGYNYGPNAMDYGIGDRGSMLGGDFGAEGGPAGPGENGRW